MTPFQSSNDACAHGRLSDFAVQDLNGPYRAAGGGRNTHLEWLNLRLESGTLNRGVRESQMVELFGNAGSVHV